MLLTVVDTGKALAQRFLDDATEIGVVELLVVAGVIHAEHVPVEADFQLDVVLEEGAVALADNVGEQNQQRQQPDTDGQNAVSLEPLLLPITPRQAFTYFRRGLAHYAASRWIVSRFIRTAPGIS